MFKALTNDANTSRAVEARPGCVAHTERRLQQGCPERDDARIIEAIHR